MAPLGSESFWSRFVGEHWQRSPVAYRQPFDSRLAAPDDILAGLLYLGRRLAEGDRSIDFRFMRLGLPPPDPEAYLPRAGDASCQAYVERLQAALAGDDFGIIVNDFQALSPVVWEGLLGFLDGLYARVGVPAGGAVTDLFMGDYKKTYLGLHKDSQDVFTFVVEGEKRALLWPFELLQAASGAPASVRHEPFELRGFDYEPYRDRAIVLEARPGDLLYWPASFWHVIEGDGRSVTTVSLGLFLHDEPLARLAAVRDEAAGAPSAPSLPVWPPSPALRAIRRVVQIPGMQRALEQRLLERRTSFGFKRVPEPMPHHEPRAGDRLATASPCRVAWMAHEDGGLSWAAGGRLLAAESPGTARLLEAVTAGEPQRVKDLLRLAKRAGVSAEEAEVVLSVLLRQRALLFDPR